ncbi:J domain-containing protein DDB_G0295729-like [Condylostylus longicornis]|uniref:J domain-containing protein DDB_G0295729-like n=1 Tax=Condylostylus longicornis TaxID=2530218 RepID=UPI00244E4CF8|nr:J domain-containing protein DDB_G0295729-like [Condylostylus longicornis]
MAAPTTKQLSKHLLELQCPKIRYEQRRHFSHSESSEAFSLRNRLFRRQSSSCSFSTVNNSAPSAFPTRHKSYYEELEVSTDASKVEIRRAFLRLAKLHHPDTAMESDRGKFQKLQVAYDVLSDDVKRREYDWKSRGIWRHSPSGNDPLHPDSEFQQQRQEFWRHWEERKKEGSEGSRIHETTSRYSEQELADMEAAERARHLEYQQRTIQRLREIGKKREASRREAYQAARSRYAENIEIRDDDFGGGPPHPILHRLFAQLRRHFGSLWTKDRFVTT